MTQGRRVKTSTLVRQPGRESYISVLTTTVPDLATQQLVVRSWVAIHWFNHQYWNQIELHDERPGDFARY